MSSITDATHFVTDIFVRTRNMLEAIASGKPVVTHLWLESIAQVKIHIDEESYLLRDTKKEKEFGFSMPASLARARKHPLLKVKCLTNVGFSVSLAVICSFMFSVICSFIFSSHYSNICAGSKSSNYPKYKAQ